MDADFEELSHDVSLISRIKQFREATLRVEDTIKRVTNPPIYDKLTTADKIKYNLLLSYALNSMFWMYLRAEGVDPMKHPIKSENDRLKKTMARAKQINDRNTLMPRVNKSVAQKFVRNALFDPKNKRETSTDNNEKT